MDMAIATALLLLLVTAPAAFAVNHVVGESRGWTMGVDYSAWATTQTFVVGDTLEFNYGTSHSVDVVDQSNYANCNSDSPLNSYTGGNNIITLNSTGTTYFTCPTSGHCIAGMKLSITVAAANPTPSGSSPPPPPPSSADPARIFGGKKHLLVEFSLLVIALIGFMV